MLIGLPGFGIRTAAFSDHGQAGAARPVHIPLSSEYLLRFGLARQLKLPGL